MSETNADNIPNDSIWKCLKLHFTKEKKEESYFDHFIDNLCVKYQYKDADSEKRGDSEDLENILKRARPSQKQKGIYRTYLKWAQILYFVYKVPFEVFDLKHEDVYDAHYTGESKVQWLRNEESRFTGEEFRSAYLSVCKDALVNTEKTLWVYDYLGKTSFKKKNWLGAYYGANTELYSIIEGKLRDGFEYIRFVALPLEFYEHLNPAGSNEKILVENPVVRFIRLCPIALLVHIYNCFRIYPAIFNNKDPFFNPGFYVVPLPSRTHHFAVLDEKSTFGEYYRFTDDGIARPDILFLESNNETSRFLTRVYGWEKDELMNTLNRKLRLHPVLLAKHSKSALDNADTKFKATLAALKIDSEDQDEDEIKKKIQYAKNELDAVSEKHRFIQHPDQNAASRL